MTKCSSRDQPSMVRGGTIAPSRRNLELKRHVVKPIGRERRDVKITRESGGEIATGTSRSAKDQATSVVRERGRLNF